MKTKIAVWQVWGFVFSCILGVILHFLFDWTGGNVAAAPFSAVNESTFEHMKLLFFPMLIFSFTENYFIGGEYESFWCIKLKGIVYSVLLIPVLFYTINGVFGKTPDWVNIGIFFASAAFGFLYETKLFKENSIHCQLPTVAFFTLIFIALLFVLFTFKTPGIPLFKDPITGTYGYFAYKR